MEVHQPHNNFSTQFPNNHNSPPPTAPLIVSAAAPTADAPPPPAPADTTFPATPASPAPLLATNPATPTPSVEAEVEAEAEVVAAAAEEASHVPALATPPDPATIPVDPPHGSPRPPPGQLLPDVAAAEEVASVPPTAAPSVFTPPPVTPTPPTDPEDIRPMDEDAPKHPEPSTEVLSATPQAGSDLTLTHVPLGATPHRIDEEDADMKMEEDVKPDAEQQRQALSEIKQENGYSNGITPAATLELVSVSEQPLLSLNGSNGYVKSPSPSAVLYPSSSYSALDHDADGPPPAKRQRLEPSVSVPPLCQASGRGIWRL
jgi:hypothetical protein